MTDLIYVCENLLFAGIIFSHCDTVFIQTFCVCEKCFRQTVYDPVTQLVLACGRASEIIWGDPLFHKISCRRIVRTILAILTAKEEIRIFLL